MIGYDGKGLSLNGLSGSTAPIPPTGSLLPAGQMGWFVRKLATNVNLRSSPEIASNVMKVVPSGTIIRVFVIPQKLPNGWPVSPVGDWFLVEIEPQNVGEFWSTYLAKYPPSNLAEWDKDNSGVKRRGYMRKDFSLSKVTALEYKETGGGGDPDSFFATGAASGGSATGTEDGGGTEDDPDFGKIPGTYKPDQDNLDQSKSGFPWLLVAGAVIGAKVNLAIGAGIAAISFLKKKSA